MQQLKLGDEDDTIALNEKVPFNVLCARSWQEGALTNIVEYSMGTKGERNRERQKQKYAAADKSTKRHWSGQIAKLHRDANRPRVVDQGGGEMVAELERPLPPPRLTGQRRQAQLNREMGERAAVVVANAAKVEIQIQFDEEEDDNDDDEDQGTDLVTSSSVN